MERMPARAQSPRVILALGVSVATPLISRLPTGIKHCATTSRCKSTNNRIPFTPARPMPSNKGAIGSHANLFLGRRPLHTLTRHHQAFTRKIWWLRGQALPSMLAVHSDSHSQPLHIGRYLRHVRPQQKAVDRLGSPPFLAQQAWDERPWSMG